MWAILMALTSLPANAGTADTLVICPPSLQPALKTWVDYRTQQGRRILIAKPPATAVELRELVKHAKASHSTLKWVVLIGDAGNGPELTPVHILQAKVNIHFGSEPEIASDNPTADLDGDGVPELAIGRIPADSPEDLQQMITKLIRYEQRELGEWKRKINFVAGVGGFGFVDNIIEMVTKQFLTDGIPAEYNTTMTYGSWKSAYCPSPPSFHAATVERLNEGCLFWVYIGHGNRYQLDTINVPGARHHILDVRDMKKLRAKNGAIAVMLACYTGAFDSPRDCIAEEMVRAEGGPVAALAGSRVTMPYAMAVMGNGLLEQYFIQRRATLGEVILHSKRGLAIDEATDNGDNTKTNALAKNRQLLDMLANAVSPKPDLVKAERLEHLALFNLIGDPLLQIHYGNAAKIQVSDESRSGQKLVIAGECEGTGNLRVELVCRRDQQKERRPNRGVYVESTLTLREFDRTYVLANDRQWAAKDLAHQGGRFETALEIPTKCQGPCYVRVFLDGQAHALGAAPVFVRPGKRQVAATLGEDK